MEGAAEIFGQALDVVDFGGPFRQSAEDLPVVDLLKRLQQYADAADAFFEAAVVFEREGDWGKCAACCKQVLRMDIDRDDGRDLLARAKDAIALAKRERSEPPRGAKLRLIVSDDAE